MTEPTTPGAALARKRWDKTSKRARSELARALARSRWDAMTAEERSEEARARHRRMRRKKK